jgi:hypothetical protein
VLDEYLVLKDTNRTVAAERGLDIALLRCASRAVCGPFFFPAVTRTLNSFPGLSCSWALRAADQRSWRHLCFQQQQAVHEILDDSEVRMHAIVATRNEAENCEGTSGGPWLDELTGIVFAVHSGRLDNAQVIACILTQPSVTLWLQNLE